jgi:hypothetical protein
VEWECTAGGRDDMRDGRLGGQGGMAAREVAGSVRSRRWKGNAIAYLPPPPRGSWLSGGATHSSRRHYGGTSPAVGPTDRSIILLLLLGVGTICMLATQQRVVLCVQHSNVSQRWGKEAVRDVFKVGCCR